MYHILAVDDDEIFLKSIRNMLEYHNYKVTTSSNPVMIRQINNSEQFDCVLLDVKIPGVDGLELLEMFVKKKPDLPVIMISGQSTIQIAVDALKMGAFDFLEKPIEAERLLITLKNALKTRELVKEKNALISELEQRYRIVAYDKAMLEILEKIETVAPTNAKVLITGETGVGKELVARALHFKSNRSSGPFVKLNCAAIPSELIESELFGYKRGAFTGALKETIGKFQMADGGTLFLDEIGDMDLLLQAKLLHVLQDNEFMMLGSTNSVKVDVRIIAATNQDLLELIHQGKFREDLYHRLNVVNINVPPLRERIKDIKPLARYFLREFADTYNKKITDFTRQALRELEHYSWPGNVRELRNVIENILVFTKSSIIGLEELQKQLYSSHPTNEPLHSGSLKEEMEDYERKIIKKTLNKTNGKMGEAAKILGINRSSLFKKKKKFGL